RKRKNRDAAYKDFQRQKTQTGGSAREKRLQQDSQARRDIQERQQALREQKQDAYIERQRQREEDMLFEDNAKESTLQAEEHERRGGEITYGVERTPNMGRPIEVKRIARDEEGNPKYRAQPLDVSSKDPNEAMAAQTYSEGKRLRGYRTAKGATNSVDPLDVDRTFSDEVPPSMRPSVYAKEGKTMIKPFDAPEQEYTGTSTNQMVTAAQAQAAEQARQKSERTKESEREASLKPLRVNVGTAKILRDKASESKGALEKEIEQLKGGKQLSQLKEADLQKLAPLQKKLDDLAKKIEGFDSDISAAEAKQAAVIMDEQDAEEAKKKTSLKAPGEK
ncbi:MAG: hypothetical protein EBU82_07435, partial [Flavobacteriia bacterium]|nr:hypothetical protein [Flavobacteriia bacterium]